ncbi:metallophosphoesterase [Olivibacter ginsenosidimutans]|uniref:Metallophosphoesterase n=1 Tax=Olivibacter ginsenosidimutans TaxID=1176537 RepID=A0ABP9BRL4_9SPHI
MFNRILFIIPIWLLLDSYFFQSLKTVTQSLSPSTRHTIHWAYWLFDLILISVVLFLIFINPKLLPQKYIFVVVSLVLLSLIPKLLILPFLLIEDLARAGDYVLHFKSYKHYPDRRKFVSQLILGLSAIPFLSIIYGIYRGKYNYKIHRHTVTYTDLPDAFDGFTITQLSDIHCGSFTDRDAVQHGIALANAQKSDLMVFTGDLVNNEAVELDEWQIPFSKLRAPYGVYSILGNHDYGDYTVWPSPEAKKANLDRLKLMQKEMGFRLLLDEHVQLEKGGQMLNLVGVQNWGKSFARYGDLDKAMATVAKDTFTILLSHDPSHWEAQILPHAKPIHLTLSGHTHGMQFGIEIPGFRWSAVKYLYHQWAGLYKKGKQFINVNRGFGFIGFSGRVGIWPEITVITLKKKV